MFKSRSQLLGLLLIPLGILYLWLAYEIVKANSQGPDVITYIFLLIFFALGVAAVFGGVNIARGRR